MWEGVSGERSQQDTEGASEREARVCHVQLCRGTEASVPLMLCSRVIDREAQSVEQPWRAPHGTQEVGARPGTVWRRGGRRAEGWGGGRGELEGGGVRGEQKKTRRGRLSRCAVVRAAAGIFFLKHRRECARGSAMAVQYAGAGTCEQAGGNDRWTGVVQAEPHDFVFRAVRASLFPARARLPLSMFFTHATGTAVGERTCRKTRE